MDVTLLVVKFVLSIGAVLGLTYIAERIGPKWAGFISAIPIGTAITLFFVGIEISPGFAAESAVYNLAGLVGLLSLIVAYYYASSKINSIAVALGAGIVGYAITVSILRQFTLEAWHSALLLLAGIIVSMQLFKKIPETKIEQKKQLTLPLLVFRGVVAASVIVIVTSVAAQVGSEWTGLFSGFPTTVVPLIVITHYTYKLQHVHTIIKHIPSGLISMIVYSLGVWYFYPLLGAYYGTLVSYGIVLVFLIAYFGGKKLLQK